MTLWNNDDTMNSKYASEKYKNTISNWTMNFVKILFRKYSEQRRLRLLENWRSRMGITNNIKDNSIVIKY